MPPGMLKKKPLTFKQTERKPKIVHILAKTTRYWPRLPDIGFEKNAVR